MAVLAGKIMFDGFSGTFYAWNEDRGAAMVFRPVIVWVTLESLPLNFWGKEEITRIVSSFGKVHKFDDNLFKKKKADVVKVMVEVEDISLIPKVVQCSYKAITDYRYRFYNVKLVPSATCLPVSQWTNENYRLYEEAGGSRGEEKEEGWAQEGGEASGHVDAARQARQPGEAQCAAPKGSVNAPMNAVRDQALEEEALPRAEINVRVAPNQREHAPAETAEERERRRKGKGVMPDWAHEAHNEDAQGQDPIISGSGSCEPMNVDDLQGDKTRCSNSADSKVNQEEALGKSKDKPILISAGNSQDEDMGGEGGGVERRESRKEVDEEKKPLLGLDRPSQEEARMAMEDARRAKGPGDKPRSEGGSRGTSVPSGYARRPRTQAGASSPFGKL